MVTLILCGLCLIGGYVAAVYTWPAIRTWVLGAEAEIRALRDKALALEAKMRRR